MDCSNYVTENIKKLLNIDVSVKCRGIPVSINKMKSLCDLIDDDILKKLRASYYFVGCGKCGQNGNKDGWKLKVEK